MLLLLQSALAGLRYGEGCRRHLWSYGVWCENPALGPAWTFTDSAINDGPVGQWVYTVTGLIRDFGGNGLCGTAAALSGYTLSGYTQPGCVARAASWPVLGQGQQGTGGFSSHKQAQPVWLCALQEGVPARSQLCSISLIWGEET